MAVWTLNFDLDLSKTNSEIRQEKFSLQIFVSPIGFGCQFAARMSWGYCGDVDVVTVGKKLAPVGPHGKHYQYCFQFMFSQLCLELLLVKQHAVTGVSEWHQSRNFYFFLQNYIIIFHSVTWISSIDNRQTCCSNAWRLSLDDHVVIPKLLKIYLKLSKPTLFWILLKILVFTIVFNLVYLILYCS